MKQLELFTPRFKVGMQVKCSEGLGVIEELVTVTPRIPDFPTQPSYRYLSSLGREYGCMEDAVGYLTEPVAAVRYASSSWAYFKLSELTHVKA